MKTAKILLVSLVLAASGSAFASTGHFTSATLTNGTSASALLVAKKKGKKKAVAKKSDAGASTDGSTSAPKPARKAKKHKQAASS
jgi:hypothetical protein